MIKQNEIFELNGKKMFFESNSIIDVENGDILKTFPKIDKIFFQDNHYYFVYDIKIPMVGVCDVYYGKITSSGTNINIEKRSFNHYSNTCNGDIYFDGNSYQIGNYNHGTSRPGKTSKTVTRYEILNNNSVTTTNNNVNTIDYSKFSYTGSLDSEPYRELLIFKDGKFYISYDTFSYFLILIISGILLFKLFIKLAKESFTLGFNFFKVGKK